MAGPSWGVTEIPHKSHSLYCPQLCWLTLPLHSDHQLPFPWALPHHLPTCFAGLDQCQGLSGRDPHQLEKHPEHLGDADPESASGKWQGLPARDPSPQCQPVPRRARPEGTCGQCPVGSHPGPRQRAGECATWGRAENRKCRQFRWEKGLSWGTLETLVLRKVLLIFMASIAEANYQARELHKQNCIEGS